MNSALEKIKHYCAYQERSHKEVRSKLLSLEVYGLELENMMTTLIEENYLNEERYARAMVRGKFYYKQWGRNKILQTLKYQEVSTYCIQQGMKEIDESDYRDTINKLAEKKMSELKSEKNKFTKMTKLRNYLLQKGYEPEYIYELFKMDS
ncbi:MAG: RecX family transcriptional regulator [Chitinophagaceae bacterium]|nr:RecX family transcriptional regulator [Chitinophagaceae bacterium]